MSDQCAVSLAGSISVSRRAESVAATRADGQYPSHWRVNHCVLQQVRQLVAQMEQQEGENDLPSTASREILFMQLLLLLRKSSLQESVENSASRLNLLLAWLEEHFADEVNWDAVADQFSLSLRTLHRQLKQQTD